MSCEPLLTALKECLLRSDCVLKEKVLPSVCLREHMDELPQQCKSLRRAVFDCKRSQLDMRKRFRG
ncbi:cytochrome c oxidase assembly protein PET191, partial [Gautieria morchelliformis]